MKSFLSTTISPDHFWELTYLVFAFYLLMHPAFAFPQSKAVALGGGLILLLFRTIQRDNFEKVGIFWYLFLFFSLTSAFWSISPGVTLESTGFLFLGTLVFLMARQGSGSSKKWIEIFVIILALMASAIAIYQWLFGFSQLASSVPLLKGEEGDIVAAAVYNRRAFGPLVTPGALAAFLIFVIPQVAVYFRISSGFKKSIWGLVGCVLLSALAATGGVGAWICLAIVMGLFFYRQNATPRAFLITALLLTMALSLVWRRGFHSWTLASFSMRVDLWKSAWQLFLQHPWVGWGWGTFGIAYQAAGFPLSTGAQFAHNLFLQLLVETGVMGTLLFVIAAWSLAIRFQWPSRWEGWGVLGGLLAVFLFSFIDLPFQMVELVWIFAAVAGRLEWKREFQWKWPEISKPWIMGILLMVFAITGFWPPYRPWNFCLLAVSLWTSFALFENQIKEIKLWIALGAVYLALRAFNSPSASGAVWFLELTGLLIVFYRLASQLPHFSRFRWVFAGLGFLWAVKLIGYCWNFDFTNWWNWVHFQLMDVASWVFYPNPKYLAIFFIPFILMLISRPFVLNRIKGIGLVCALLIVFRLKALSALVGLGVGWLWNEKKSWKKLLMVAITMIVFLVGFRFLNTSSTKWGRWGIWESALRVWSESPLWGVGPGVFAGDYHRVQTPRTVGPSRYLMDAVYAHNEFLDLLTAFGLMGFVFVLILAWKFFQRIQEDKNKSALVGLGTASFFNFCLHTPLIALLGVSCAVEEEKKPHSPLSLWSGFLIGGLSLSLFGSPVFSLLLIQQAQKNVFLQQYPQAFQCWYQAVDLNEWNEPMVAGESNFYERLYTLTHDETWKVKSDDAFQRAMNLEKADGNLVLEKAKRWTRRYEWAPSDQNFVAARESWAAAEKVLPFNAYVPFEEGLFWTRISQLVYQPLGLKIDGRQMALDCYSRCVQLEPDFAAAWVNLGLCQPRKEAEVSFKKALSIYDKWSHAPGLSPDDRQLVGLPAQVVWRLQKGMTP